MTKKENYLALALRCETEEDSHDLNEQIALACGWKRNEYDAEYWSNPRDSRSDRLWTIPTFMRNRDAAMNLLPEEVKSYYVGKGRLTPEEPLYGMIAYSDEGGEHEIAGSETNTGEAAAICATALRARAALEPA